MLNTTTISKLADALGMKAEDLTAKITSEKEEELTIEGEFFSDEQLSKRDSGKYNEGKEAGQEMLIKDAKKKHNYEFDGKDIDSLLEFHKGHIEKTFKKDKSEWQTDFEKQKETYEAELLKERQEKENLVEQFRKQKVTNNLLSLMPKETTIKKEAIITLFNSEYNVIEEDGKTVIVKGGEKLKDPKSTDPLTLDQVFNDFVLKEGYIKQTPGRGGDNAAGGQSKYSAETPQDFEKQWKQKNPDKSTASPDYSRDYQEFRKAQTAA